MTKPTYQDATLMLQFAQWATAADISQARDWMFSDEFVPDYSDFIKKYPPGSEEYRKVSDICMWMETLGTLHKHGLFNEDLLFDWLAVDFMWDRARGFALGLREQFGSPALYENFEAMANAKKER